uniref:Putative trilaris n=1 Tax=Rhipicephalus pulchellus TaxID=72859 RepID=L7LR14_RHIPC
MKLVATLVVLICVNYIYGSSWFKDTKKENGLTKEQLKACSKPPFVGVCHPLNEAWYYDKKDNSCKLLKRGTCAGGNNLFPTMKRCMKSCIPLTPNNSPTCLQRPVIGSCAPVIVAWYYDATSGFCKMFNHTICGGGPNMFLTEMKCQSACRLNKKPKAVCSLKPSPGRCLFANRRWYFSETDNTCRLFLKKRCGSNDNAFATQMKCLERCSYNKATCVNCGQTQGNELPSAKAPGKPDQAALSNGIPVYRPHNLS